MALVKFYMINCHERVPPIGRIDWACLQCSIASSRTPGLKRVVPLTIALLSVPGCTVYSCVH